MPSPQLILAAQTNGKLSRGPVSPEGKRKSSANSRKHGLRAKTLETDEACEAYRKWLLPSLIAKHDPANPTELDLVETIALAAARQDWALRLFDQVLADAIQHQIHPEAPHQHRGRHAMDLYHRACCRFDREERRARKQLRHLQSQPQPPVPSQPQPPETPKMNERTLSAAAAQPAPPASTGTNTDAKMNERTESPGSTHQPHTRPPLIPVNKLKSKNRIPFAPSPACGNPETNPKRT